MYSILVFYVETRRVADGEFSHTLKAGWLSELVVIRPAVELNSYSLLDKFVVDDTRATLRACSGSSIFKDPMDP